MTHYPVTFHGNKMLNDLSGCLYLPVGCACAVASLRLSVLAEGHLQ